MTAAPTFLTPSLLPPRGHRRFDLFALPGMLALAAWMARRTRTVAFMLTVAAVRGTAFLTTDRPLPRRASRAG